MTIRLNFACVVTAFTALVISGILTAQSTVPVTAQGSSSNPGSGSDPTSLLQSAKMHLIQALKAIKTGNSQSALTEINMTNQGINSAEARLNASVICNNVNNEGFCEAPG
ncbi:MAG TPA: hypothetical protein VEL11_05340 [Candidatus Bathyarchaeia archaeon]|nr:hypothetical protein [Candidatus Bathyarchaeia archaeon]